MVGLIEVVGVVITTVVKGVGVVPAFFSEGKNIIQQHQLVLVVSLVVEVEDVVVVVEVVSVVVASSSQSLGTLSKGGLLGPDLHAVQAALWDGQVEWRWQASGEEE